MRIGFVFTNYNNSRLSIQAVKSISANRGACDCDVVLVDNASVERERAVLAEPGALPDDCTVIWNPENLGYFSGLNLGIAALRERPVTYDAIVIGNNDLVFEPGFFEALETHRHHFERHSVISPNIITLENVHQNPHVIRGISRTREIIWDLYYSNFLLSRLIGRAARCARQLTARKDYLSNDQEGPIRQGYGACYILTPRFLETHQALWSPGFVMGEEFFLSRQLAARNEKMYYLPGIPVRHHDHATVRTLPSRRLWEMTRDSHRIYRFFISPYRRHMDNHKSPADYEKSIDRASGT